MPNTKLQIHIREIGWSFFLEEIADLARDDAGTYGPRNDALMLLADSLTNLSREIEGLVVAPSWLGTEFTLEGWVNFVREYEDAKEGSREIFVYNDKTYSVTTSRFIIEHYKKNARVFIKENNK